MDTPQFEALVRDLNTQLEKARHAYYVLADPIMTDAAYDLLEARLKGLVKANPQLTKIATALTTVGSDVVTPGTKIYMADSKKKSVEDIKIGDVVATSTGRSRIKHVRPMLSIENQYTKEDVVKFVLSLPAGTAVCVEPKRDGTSNENRYFRGLLKASLTRGTGVEGEDQTAQVKVLTSIPQSLVSAPLLDAADDINIRGELVMRNGELDRLNKEATAAGTKTYAATRNLTAGTMKQKNLAVVASREILFMPWDIYSPSNDTNLPDSNYERMRLLEKAGFPKYEGILVTNPNSDSLIKAIDAILALNAKSDIRADGVVIKVDSHKLRKELGVATKFTNWMTCFKPQSLSGTTYLRKIIWQIGRQGALTPVAECDPVVLAGAVVTRASLNNETWIATLGLTIGAKVEMLRSGDVIPQIVKVLDDTGDPIIPPTHCPECGNRITVWTEPKSDITSRFCENGMCPGRICGLFSYISDREFLEIDGLGDDMAMRIVKGEFARNIGELFEFQVEQMEALKKLQDKLGEEPGETKFLTLMAKQGFSITVLKMFRSMEKAKTAPWNKWIAAFGIPMVGRTLGKLLAKELKLEAEDMPNLCTKLEAASKSNIEGLGDVKSDMLKNWSLDPVNRLICEALYRAGVRPTSTVVKAAAGGQPLAGVVFCITGEFDFADRVGLTQTLESLGATSKTSVSKKLTHLIVGDSGAGKSKLTTYDSLISSGCKIEKVGRDWVVKTLEAAGMPVKAAGFSVEEV